MHLHLDPVGGIAGDMFAAAILDAWPDLAPGLEAGLRRAGLGGIIEVAHRPYGDGILHGSCFEVTPVEDEPHAHAHRSYRDVRALIGSAELPDGVRERALDIFRLLAEAEARVHATSLDDVVFHEVGSRDAIADVVSAAWLIESVGASQWSCSALPLGRGRVRTAHGELSVPVPAVAELLRGFVFHDDGRDGERVTPTGAAILRHLRPLFSPMSMPGRLKASGIGFGSQQLHDMSNVLRVLAFEAADDGTACEMVGVCAFEVDDQTPEDLAVALDRLRSRVDVLDVTQTPTYGKQGRITMRVQVLARADALESVVAACLDESTTLGVRYQKVTRRVLRRETYEAHTDDGVVHVKEARRPDGSLTRKAEMADIAASGHARRGREALRAVAEARRSEDTGRRTDDD